MKSNCTKGLIYNILNNVLGATIIITIMGGQWTPAGIYSSGERNSHDFLVSLFLVNCMCMHVVVN